MIFYSFYTDKYRDPKSLVYRTEDEYISPDPEYPDRIKPTWSEFQVNLKMFDQKGGPGGAEQDFFSILWNNPDFRIGEYFDTEKNKKKKEKEVKEVKIIDDSYKTLPSDFKLELNKVYNLDCMLFMKELPDKYIDYVCTSPPYNAGKRTSHGKNNSIYKDDESMYALYEDEMADDEYEKWLFEIIRELLRVTKKHIFFNIQMLGKNKRTVLQIFSEFKMYIKDIIIWEKTIASPHIVKGIMNSAFEFIFIFSNDEPQKRKFNDGNFKGNFRNVIRGVNASQNKYKDLNKATYPLYLPRTIMQKFGKKADLWYDPFSGTGTTFHAACVEERNFVGTEIDINQCEATNNRIFVEEGTLKIEFPEEGDVVYGVDYGVGGSVQAIVKVTQTPDGEKVFEEIKPKEKVKNLEFDFDTTDNSI